MEIEILKEEKKENVKNGLIGFLKEYESVQNNPNNFSRHSDNCGNQARKVAEAFCRYVILSSDKPDGQKINEIEGTLGTLHEKVTRSSNVYIEDSREREVLKTRLKRILDIGNEASHDNNVITTQYDLDEIKNNLLYLSEYLFGKEFVGNITSNISSQNIIDNSPEDIQEKVDERKIEAKTYIENINNTGTINFS